MQKAEVVKRPKIAFIKFANNMWQNPGRVERSMRSPSIELPVRAGSLHRTRGARWLRFAGLAAMILLRSGAAQQAGRLIAAHTIQVASLGGGSGAEALRQRIVERLNRSGRLEVVASSSPADFTLRGTSSIWAAGRISFNPRSKAGSETIYQGYLSVELVGADNQVVWSYLATPSRFRSASITNDLADQIVARLLRAIEGDAEDSMASAAARPAAHLPLHAAGSTLAAPLYLKWFQSAGFTVSYDAVGSEAGIAQLAEGKVDFAASDIPLSAENTAAQLRVAQFPIVLGAVVPIYNLPGLERNLRLTPEVLAGIYSGAIVKWNDPRILAANRGAHLPGTEIAVVHRSDGSGTTYVWTNFLALASPEWKAGVGAGPEVRWPVGVGAAGNNGVAESVEKTPNAIGYVELIYAIQHELNYAAVRNPAGEFVKADLQSITLAAAGAPGAAGSPNRFSLLNSGGRDAYPISTFTWLLVPAEGLSAEKRAAIVALLDWMLTSGQKECASLGYAPLPHDIAASELQAVITLK